MKTTYFGISTENELEPIEATLENQYSDDGEEIYISKATSEIELDGKKCKVKLGVWVIDIQQHVPSIDTKNGDFKVYLFVVPDVKTMGQNALKSVAHTCGIESSEVTEDDVRSYGFEVPLGSDVKLEGITGLDDPKLLEVVKFAGTVAPTILGLIGFYLDRPVNGFGDTGWKIASEWVK